MFHGLFHALRLGPPRSAAVPRSAGIRSGAPSLRRCSSLDGTSVLGPRPAPHRRVPTRLRSAPLPPHSDARARVRRTPMATERIAKAKRAQIPQSASRGRSASADVEVAA